MCALIIGVGPTPADALAQRRRPHGRGHGPEGDDGFFPVERLADLHRPNAFDGCPGVCAREVLVSDVLVPVCSVELGAEQRHRALGEGGEELPHLCHHLSDVGLLRVELFEHGLRITASLHDGCGETVDDRGRLVEVADDLEGLFARHVCSHGMVSPVQGRSGLRKVYQLRPLSIVKVV